MTKLPGAALLAEAKLNERLRERIRELEAFVKMAQAEAVTLIARLPEPYAKNQRALADAAHAILAKVSA